jgi:hypothetical protein
VNPSGSITPGFQEFTDLCAFLIDSALEKSQREMCPMCGGTGGYYDVCDFHICDRETKG